MCCINRILRFPASTGQTPIDPLRSAFLIECHRIGLRDPPGTASHPTLPADASGADRNIGPALLLQERSPVVIGRAYVMTFVTQYFFCLVVYVYSIKTQYYI